MLSRPSTATSSPSPSLPCSAAFSTRSASPAASSSRSRRRRRRLRDYFFPLSPIHVLHDSLKATLDEDLFVLFEKDEGMLTELIMIQNCRSQKKSAQALSDLSMIVDDGVLI